MGHYPVVIPINEIGKERPDRCSPRNDRRPGQDQRAARRSRSEAPGEEEPERPRRQPRSPLGCHEQRPVLPLPRAVPRDSRSSPTTPTGADPTSSTVPSLPRTRPPATAGAFVFRRRFAARQVEGRSAGRSTSTERRAVRVEPAPLGFREPPRVGGCASSARRLRSPSARSRLAAWVAAPLRRAAGSGRAFAAGERGWRRRTRLRSRASARTSAESTSTEIVGMSPPATIASGSRAHLEAGQQPDERPAVRLGVLGAAHRHAARVRQEAIVARGDDDDHLGADRRDRVDRPIQQRPAVDASPPACPIRTVSSAPPARTMPLTRGAAMMVGDPSWPPRSRARGPGTWPSGVRLRTPRRPRSSRIAITYLRLVPVASRSAAGVSGDAPASSSARRSSSRYADVRRRRGRRRSRRSAGPTPGRESPRAGSRRGRRPRASGGGAGVSSARSRRSIAASCSGDGPVAARSGSRRRSPSAVSRPSEASRSIAPLDEVRGGGRVQRDPATQLPRGAAAEGCPRHRLGRLLDCADDMRPPATAPTSGASREDGVGDRTVQLQPCREPCFAAGRCRCEAPRGGPASIGGGDTPRRFGVEDAAAGERRAGRGSSDDEARRRGRRRSARPRRRIAAASPSGSVGGVASAAADRRLDPCRAEVHEDSRADPSAGPPAVDAGAIATAGDGARRGGGPLRRPPDRR